MHHSNPNRGYWNPPPLVTYTSEPTRAMPATTLAAPRRRRNTGTWLAAVGTAVLGAALGAVLTAAATDTSTPESCLVALDHAEDIRAQTSELSGHYATLADISARSVDAAASWDVTQIEPLTAELDALNMEMGELTDRAGVTRDAYETAAADCRAEGGEVR